MELNTFGAVLGFAVDYEQQAADWYARAVTTAGPTLGQRFQELADAHARRRKLMERVRRENVTEMILEPITGLDGALYEPDAQHAVGDAGLAQQAMLREDKAEQFYLAASVKVSIPEVARIFKKVAREIAESREGLA